MSVKILPLCSREGRTLFRPFGKRCFYEVEEGEVIVAVKEDGSFFNAAVIDVVETVFVVAFDGVFLRHGNLSVILA